MRPVSNLTKASRGCSQLSQPDEGACKMNEGEERLGEFVVASGDTAKLLDPTEESLDEISTFVAVLVEFTLDATVAARRDNGLNV